MVEALIHRGPDDDGLYCQGPIGLGHRRLSIIDLSPAGHQPMATGDGRFVLVYNGEVYNFAELRDELADLGYGFRSRTDSEVVLNALVEWGAAALNRFNGMFALALWDGEKERLLLARDRYGIKPLYFTSLGGELLFASEIKSFLAHPDFQVALDEEGLVEYFTFQNFFSNRTLFKGVEIFPAGCYAVIEKGGPAHPSPTRYWDYAFHEPQQAADEREYIEELDRLFRQAVGRQLVSDVDVGTYLSGGMDTGSITAVAAQQVPYIKSFTCGFDLSSASGIELNFDERATAERMSYLFKTEHYEMVLKAGDMERILPQLTWHLEEPRVGQSYPNYYIARLAGKFVKVILSGTGGDELFAGYPWRYYRAAVNDGFDNYIDKYFDFWQRLLSDQELKAVFRPIWKQAGHTSPRDIFRSVFPADIGHPSSPEDYINHSLYFEAKTFLHGLLVIEDKLSMAHSLETRVPFLDNDLVDFAMQIPMKMKLRRLDQITRLNENEPGAKTTRYFQKTNDGKLILRRVMTRHIPREITEKEKQGFSAPDASWFKGESIDYVRRVLFGKETLMYHFLDRKAVQEVVNDHLEGRRNRRLLVWSLLNFENWCRVFLAGNACAEPGVTRRE